MPRRTNTPTIASGIVNGCQAALPAKLPSSMGFNSAGNSGSVAPTSTMLNTASANTFQCGRT